MKVARILLATGLLLALLGPVGAIKARAHSSFSLHAPGFNLHIGKYPAYRYYGPYNYQPYYAPYYRPYTYRRSYSGGRCARWSRRCAANWGYRNRNYYGCMRYHRCR